MVLWQGLTEGGTAVPVQVTEEGKVVAQGQQGEKGEKGDKGDTGDQGPAGPPGEYGPGDDVELNKAYFAGNVAIGGNQPFDATYPLDVRGHIRNTRYLIMSNGERVQYGTSSTAYVSGSDNSSNGGYIQLAANGNIGLHINNDLDCGIGTHLPSTKLHVTGGGFFHSDVVVGSRNKQWMLVESGGLCHMVDQSNYLTTSTYTNEDGEENTLTHWKQPGEYPVLRDIQAELTMVEQQLQKVMERLKMVPEAGWEVWDGAD